MARPTFTVAAPPAVAAKSLGLAVLFFDVLFTLMTMILWLVLLPVQEARKAWRIIYSRLQRNDLNEAVDLINPEDDGLAPNELGHQVVQRDFDRVQSPLLGSLYGVLGG